MLSSFVDGTDQSETSIPSFSPPAGDDTLVLAAKNGNEQAFEILVEHHRRRIFVVALRFTRVREDAEDIAQQSFQKAFLHLRRFQGESSFLMWLRRIAINEALMWLRGNHRHRVVPIDEVSDDVGEALWRVELSDSDPDITRRWQGDGNNSWQVATVWTERALSNAHRIQKGSRLACAKRLSH